ncbi:hypothetical protein [Arthrobacter burdickii]|uniref:Uncharacterized protein n=1 Tax=Arthrobacter burdickii TaxID=3035920 RepID=A0ABT8K4E7_9MICC|nr:hypothetical protein [Arthrobacter burdickii]MDN4611447.1 hypothetical protein [Arthrobacter burdickii]
MQKLIAEFEYEARFPGRVIASPEKVREILHHYSEGSGSLDDRRNEIIINILGIDTGTQRGWDAGTYRKGKERCVLLPFALYLAHLGPDTMAEANAA